MAAGQFFYSLVKCEGDNLTWGLQAAFTTLDVLL